jgi:hypothetical protein
MKLIFRCEKREERGRIEVAYISRTETPMIVET